MSVVTQPSGETCSVGSGSGTMGTADVGNVSITCAANAYHVGGGISGLTSAGLILANGTDTGARPQCGELRVRQSRRVRWHLLRHGPAAARRTHMRSRRKFSGHDATADVTNVDVTCTPSTGLQLVAGQISCPLAGHRPTATARARACLRERAWSSTVSAISMSPVSSSRTVRKVTPAGDVTTIAGQYTTGGSTDGTGSAARFVGPQGIALDASGNLYVGDDDVMRKVTPAGVVTTLAGTPSSAGLVDATGSAARFNQIRNVVADTAGNVYIADQGNNVIRKMTPAGVVTTFAGGGGAGGTAAGFADGTGTAALFAAPRGLAIDAAATSMWPTTSTGRSARSRRPES